MSSSKNVSQSEIINLLNKKKGAFFAGMTVKRKGDKDEIVIEDWNVTLNAPFINALNKKKEKEGQKKETLKGKTPFYTQIEKGKMFKSAVRNIESGRNYLRLILNQDDRKKDSYASQGLTNPVQYKVISLDNVESIRFDSQEYIVEKLDANQNAA